MEWLNTVEEFLNEYKNEDYFLGAIVTGSYVSGNNDDKSDIDVFVVTKDSTTWRERGNKLINGYLIEYFINPKRKVISEMEEGLKNYHTATVNMFANSKILYDKDGSIKELIDMACSYKKNLKLEKVDDDKYKMNCYAVWDSFDELMGKYRNNLDIEFTYNYFLTKLIEGYFYGNQIPSIPLNKIEIILKDEVFRDKYKVAKMPDQDFIDLLISCFDAKDEEAKILAATNIYNYFFMTFDDFDINNFSLRSDV